MARAHREPPAPASGESAHERLWRRVWRFLKLGSTTKSKVITLIPDSQYLPLSALGRWGFESLRTALDPAQHQVLYGVEAYGAQPEGVTHRLVHLLLAEVLHQPQHLHVLPLAAPAHPRLEQPAQHSELLPDTKVLMITASTEEDAVVEAIAAGATGFVQKYSGSDELVDTLRQVAEGRLMIPDDAMRRVFRLIRGGTHLMPGPKMLTSREREVLAQFARGKSYAQIADALGVSMVTVRNAIYRVQDKIGVDSKQEIVVWAVRNGLLDGEEGDTQPPP